MSNITQLKDKDGNNIYPISSDKLILDENGKSIGERLDYHLENHPRGFSGDYTDLTNKPAIPKKVSELTNDLGFITIETETEINTKLNTKVDKVDGKVLSSNDYTTAEKSKLASLSNYTHPSTHPASIIVQDTKNRFVTDAEKSIWNNKSDFSGDYNDLINKPSIPSINGLATETYVDTKVSRLVNSAPETLDTLQELSEALGNNPNFATTIATQIGTKADTTYVKAELAKKSDVHSHPYKSSSYVPTWSEITSKPSTFTPSSHSHDNYIKFEVLSGTVTVPTVTIFEEE